MAQTSQAKFGEPIKVKDKIVSCDGGAELSHPRVFLEIKQNGRVTCPYCSQEFIYKK